MYNINVFLLKNNNRIKFVGHNINVGHKLIRVGYSSHATHDTENVVVNSVYTDLSGVDTRDSSGGKDKLHDSVVNSGEVAATGRLVFLRAKSE